jgi:hypothetical protein
MSLCGSNMPQKRVLITRQSRISGGKKSSLYSSKKAKSSISKALGRIPRLFFMMPSVSKKLLFHAKCSF